MLRRIRAHVGYANVVATVALVFAMSGSAYALVVSGALVVDETLTEADVRDGTLSSAIAGNAITSAKVAPDALTGDDIDESTLAVGGGLPGAFVSFEHDTDVGDTYEPIITRTLAPGRYLLQGELTFRNTSGVAREATCGVQGSALGHNPQTTVPVQGAASLSVNTYTEIDGADAHTVGLVCIVSRVPFGEPAFGHVEAYGTLTAIEVSSVDAEL